MNRFTAPAIALTAAGILALTACGGPTEATPPPTATVTATATPEAVETTVTPAACITAMDIASKVQDINIRFVEDVAVGYIELIPKAHEAGLRGDTEAAGIVTDMGELTDTTNSLTAELDALQADMATASTECRANTGDES